MRLLRVLFASAILVLPFACSSTQPKGGAIPTEIPSPVIEKPDAPSEVPLDPSVVSGTLPNGLRYFVKTNGRPEDRAELRLAVDVGSVQEDDDQRGMAHFVEHMAFNGTERFEKQELVDYLELSGTRFGADLNAYTSFDETVYMLKVQTDSLELFETGFDILREWASRVSFEDEEIEKERGVVLEEWRSRRGGDARVQDQHFKALFAGSRYEKRLPIGTPESIENATPDAIRRFYTDWYRPNLMAVIAVGDFDADEVEGWIKSKFSDMTNPEGARMREEYSIPDNVTPGVSVAFDREANFSTVGVTYKLGSPQRSAEAYRANTTVGLFNGMLGRRLQELTQKADPPFVFAFAGKGPLVRERDAFNLDAVVQPGNHAKALKTMLMEAERVRKFGFTDTELERMKTDYLANLERAYNEREKTESRTYAQGLVAHALSGSAFPGIAYDIAQAKEVYPTIGTEDVNKLAAQWMTEENRVLTAGGKIVNDVRLPTEEQLLGVFSDPELATVEAYEDEVSAEPLIGELPEPTGIVSEESSDELGVTRLSLANGVQVVLKPTNFKNDEVLLSATSPGGTSLLEDADYTTISMAMSSVAQGGVSSFDDTALRKKLTGKIARVRPQVGSREEGFSGSSSSEDLETMFELVYLYATSPRKDVTAFESFKSRIGGMMLGMKDNPESVFADTVSQTMSQYHPRSPVMSQEMLDNLDFDAAFDFYQNRFEDFSDFTFYLVGSFELDQAKALSDKYLSVLPSTNRVEEARDTGIRPPTGQIEKTVYAGVEPKSSVRLIYTGPFSYSRENRAQVNMVTSVLRLRLREVLREDLGGVYGVRVSGSASKEPVPAYRMSISFGCDPDRVEELIGAVQSTLDEMKSEPVSEDYLTKVKETELTSHETNIKTNQYWLRGLESADRLETDPENIVIGPSWFHDQITPANVLTASKRYLNPANRAIFKLMPEN